MNVPIEDLHRQIEGWRRRRLRRSMLPRSSVEATLALAEEVLRSGGPEGARGAAGLLDTLALLEAAHRERAGAMLGAAESLGAEILLDLEARLAALGWSEGPGRMLPPVAWKESVPSPLVWRRDLNLPAPSLVEHFRLRLPFALVILPSDHLSLPWRLASVAHEVGHAVDNTWGLGARVRAAVGGERARGLRSPAWLGGWLGEVVADLVGLAGVGPVLGDVLRFVVDGLEVGRGRSSSSHPSLLHRVALLRRAWGVLGERPDELTDVDPDIAHDVRLLVGDDVLGLAPALRRGPPPGSWGDLPSRALEAAGGQVGGADDEPHGDEVEERAWSVFRQPPPPPPEPGQEALAALRSFWHARVPRLAPTAVERTGSMLKRPPSALFAQYEELFLVGATHRSLIAALEAGLAERGGRRWGRVEVLFLGRNEDLPRIYAGEKEDFVAVRREVRGLLPAVLDRASERSFVGDHPSCTLFASFLYEPPAPGLAPARWYVHTSAAVWGQSISVAPSADYRSVSGDLSGDPEIHALLQGLRHLRGEAGCRLPFPGEG